MRTLDEVIKAVEEDLECANESYPEVFYDYDNHKDALHYLKEYRETKKHLACLDHHESRGDNTQVVNNPPLTWEELKTMEGKPVWVEYNFCIDNKDFRDKSKRWCIVREFEHWYDEEIIITENGFVLSKNEQIKDWQAYRKKRK